MPTTYPQVAHHVIHCVNPVIFLGWGETKRFDQCCHGGPFSVDQFLECDVRTGPAGRIPDPRDGLLRVSGAQK